MTVVTLCDETVTDRHDVTDKLPNMVVPLKIVTDVTVCDGLGPQTKTGQVKQDRQSCQSYPSDHDRQVSRKNWTPC